MLLLFIVIGCYLLIAYTYAGYPLLIAWIARHRPTAPTTNTASVPSRCSVVIAVHNDAAALTKKIAALLTSDSESLSEILIGSDGSTDDPAAHLSSINDDRIRLETFSPRCGKTSVLNTLAVQCKNEIIVMMDARQIVRPGSLPALLARFSDPQVGVVSGELIFQHPSVAEAQTAASGMGAYWHYEKWIRKNEAAVASVPGATGACYAIRRSLFKPIPPEVILDDVAYPMQAVMKGYRCVFEEEAVVFDRPSSHSGQETIRKRRTLAGNVQLLQLFPALIKPTQNPIWFQYLSHKVLRLCVPFFALLALCCALIGYGTSSLLFFPSVILLNLLFTGGCIIGGLLEQQNKHHAIFSLFWMLYTLNRATFFGVIDGLRKRYQITWQQAYSTTDNEE